MATEASGYDNSSINSESQHFAHLVDMFAFKGRPRNLDTANGVVVLINHGCVVGFSPARNQPVWAAYRVSRAERDVNYARPHLFYEDLRLPPENQIRTYGFGKHQNKSYDRGHVVPNFAINTQFGRLAQMETFFMSNICPQFWRTNRGIWAALEKKILLEYAPQWEHIWVLAGPIFGANPYRIKRRTGVYVDIPKAFFCILIDPIKYPHDNIKNVEILTLRIEQDAGYEKLATKHITSIDAIEKATKLNLFPKLTKKERTKVEKQVAPDIWDSRLIRHPD